MKFFRSYCRNSHGSQLIFFLLILLPVFGHASPMLDFPWEPTSDPVIMSGNFERDLDRLPKSGSVPSDGRFWSGDYWALNKGNINYRWHSPRPTGFGLRSPGADEVRNMTLAELSHLSPSEKFDIMNSRYDYPLRHEVEKIANPNADIWEGICHGWAPASMNHREPFAKGVKNNEGILIPFGSSDIKALISYYYANGFYADNHQMGRRCYPTGGHDCDEDLNAGAFHIVLTNKVGLHGEGFIIDIKAGPQVWNHPIINFQSQAVAQDGPIRTSAPGTVRRIKFQTRVRVVLGTDNYWETVRGTSAQKETNLNYVYYLDLNADNVIIGGDWESTDRPDFLWIKLRPPQFQGMWSRLGILLND
ncbi:MAG: hypothetical protein ACJ76H_09330 [Bacteriovoracaceae bacterium]